MTERFTMDACRQRTPVTRVLVCEDARSSIEVLALWGHNTPVIVEWANYDAGILDHTRGWLREPHDYDDAVHLMCSTDRGPSWVSFPLSIVRSVEIDREHAEQ